MYDFIVGASLMFAAVSMAVLPPVWHEFRTKTNVESLLNLLFTLFIMFSSMVITILVAMKQNELATKMLLS